jgi:cystathionine beta-lyase family protein involved in aluminum resistance
MTALEAKIDIETNAEMTTRKKLIESQMSQQFSNKKTILITKLQELLDKVETPPALHFVQAQIQNIVQLLNVIETHTSLHQEQPCRLLHKSIPCHCSKKHS